MVRIHSPPAKSHANHRFLPLAPVKERLSNESKGSKRHSALSAATKPQAGALCSSGSWAAIKLKRDPALAVPSHQRARP